MAETLSAAEQASVVAAAGRAAERFPWYRSMLEARVFLDSARIEAVPILCEEILATTYYATAAAATSPGERVYVTSGTSTGVRKRVHWTAHDHECYVAHRSALFRSFLGDSCRTAVADLGTGHAAASAMEIFAALSLDGRDIDVALPLERHVESLREWQADLLYTMPMILERIVGAGGPGYVPKWIVVLGDVAPAAWRAAMEARLGMKPGRIVDVFGSIEVGAIAYSDDEVGGYLFHEHIVPEVTEPTEPRMDGGQLLVLTSLDRDGFPVIRYASGDVILGLRSVVVDGRPRWAYQQHLGREGAEIKHGEMLTLYAMADAIGSEAPGVAWSVRRVGLEVVIEIDERVYTETAASRIREAVRAAHPAVDRMIRSGLVGDLAVQPRFFPASATKRTVR